MMSNLKRTRLLQGKNQYDLMLETGIDQALISLFENDYRKPSEIQKKNLARALKVKVEEIFPEE